MMLYSLEPSPVGFRIIDTRINRAVLTTIIAGTEPTEDERLFAEKLLIMLNGPSRGGTKGGAARAAALTPERRSEIGRKAGKAGGRPPILSRLTDRQLAKRLRTAEKATTNNRYRARNAQTLRRLLEEKERRANGNDNG